MFRSAATTLPQTLRRTLRQMGGVALACSLMALSGCGGGDRAEEYRPSSVVSFGDENSLMEDFSSTALDPAGGGATKTIQGLMYTVNTVISTSLFPTYCNESGAATRCVTPITGTPVTDDGFAFTPAGTPGTYYFDALNADVPNGITNLNILSTITLGTSNPTGVTKQVIDRVYRCDGNKLWVQNVAHYFGKGFGGNCPYEPDGAVSYAASGAKVAGISAQVQQALDAGALHEGVLVTLMVGQHDITELFEGVLVAVDAAQAQADAEAELARRAADLSAQVRTIIETKAKVIVALVPDLSQSPYPAAIMTSLAPGLSADERATMTGRLKEMVRIYNEKVQITGLGSISGRTLTTVNPYTFFTGQTGYNYAETACDYTLVKKPDGTAVSGADKVKYCTTDYLRSPTTAYMWADETHLTPAGHALIGGNAYLRAADQF